MRICEFDSGSRRSYEAEGEHNYKDFTDEIRRLYPVESSGKHFRDVVYIYKKYGKVKAPGNNNRFFDTMVKCEKSDPNGRVYSRVVML